jgi:pyrimidine deaminase RibD-like protein
MNPTKLQSLLHEALLHSKKSPMAFKHGALIIRQGRVIGSGFNDHHGHAELNAIGNVYRSLCDSRGKDR